MKYLTKTFLLTAVLAVGAQATVIDFDGFNTGANSYVTLVNPGETAAIGQGYQATSLGGWDIVISENYNSEWAGGVSSGSNTMGIHDAVKISRIDSAAFDFNGGFFTNIYNTAPINLILQGWSGGTMTYSTSLVLSGAGTNLAYNWTGIDYLVINNTHYDWMGLDDLQVNGGNTVPDGGAGLSLMGMALVGLVAARRQLTAVR